MLAAPQSDVYEVLPIQAFEDKASMSSNASLNSAAKRLLAPRKRLSAA